MIPENINLFNLLQVAVNAGKMILKIYEKDFTVEYKEDESPLTEADQQANKVITDELTKLYPEIPILSEESKAAPFETRNKWDYFWLVDPLDGTKEFVKKNGEFTVNIALINKGRPVLGIVYVPVKHVLYFGGQGIGSYKTEDSSLLNNCKTIKDAINISKKLPLEKDADRPFTVVGSRSHMSDETRDYINDQEKKHGKIDVISIGSSLKLCLVAEGKAEVYPRFAPTMEWDTGAGHAVVEFSGAKVIKAENKEPLEYNKENLLNPWFIAIR